MSTLAAPQTAVSTWNIDPAHSVAEFKVKHMMISNVKGQFAKVSGVLNLDESDPTNSHIEASIEAGSLNTRDDQRDTHLRSADFFHVEQHPTLAFKSTRVKRTGDGELAVTGDLTIRGVTRNVDFAVMRRIPLGSSRAIEVRAEVFNLVNTPNFGAPAAVQGAANFGTITSAFDPRVVQIALKFIF